MTSTLQEQSIRQQKKAINRTLPAASLFSGGGGLDLGMEVAGFETQCCVDIDSCSCQSLELNRDTGRAKKLHKFLSKAQVIPKDIREITGKDLLKDCGGEVAFLYGGPPCQAFSVFGRRQGLKDPRGTLLWEFVRLVNETRPKAFLLENVGGLKTFGGRSVLDLLEHRLSLDGHYTITTHEYELAEFGIPQFRRRVFLIGSRDGIIVPEMVPTHGPEPVLFGGLRPYRTAGEALRGLPEPGDNGKVPNHFGREHSQRIIDRYRSLRYGERDPKTRINKLDPKRPSFTIIVGSDAGGGKGHVHPSSPREVTPRESARMQTFPDCWEFTGGVRDIIRQVGNAVPPLFAALLGSHLKKHLFGARSAISYDEAVEALQLDYLRK